MQRLLTRYITLNKLSIIGSGLEGESGFSPLYKNLLEKTAVVFCIEPYEDFVKSYPSLAQQCESLDWAFDEYENDRSAALSRIGDYIIEAMQTVDQGVFLLSGHPTLAVAPVQRILDKCPDWLAVDIMPGLSSVDYMLADLGIDIVDQGLQIVGGHQVSLLSPALPVAIISPGYSNTVKYSDRLQRLSRLVKELIEHYGEASEFIVYTKKAAGFSVDLRPVTDLVSLAVGGYLGDKLLIGPQSLLRRSINIG